MYHAIDTLIELDTAETQGALIYKDHHLIAVASRLAGEEHGGDVGKWHVEAYFAEPRRQFPLFLSLDGLVRHFGDSTTTTMTLDAPIIATPIA